RDALVKESFDLGNGLSAQILPDDVSSERQRQAGLAFPPLSQVDHQREVLIAVGKLPLVNDKPGVDRLPLVLARNNGRDDLVEGDDNVVELLPEPEPQREKRAGELAGDGNPACAKLL